MAGDLKKPEEISADNIQPITEDQLKPADKAEYDACMEEYRQLLMGNFGRTRDGAVKKAPLPRPWHVIVHAEPRKLQEMMTKAMHHSLIDQSSVFNNTVPKIA